MKLSSLRIQPLLRAPTRLLRSEVTSGSERGARRGDCIRRLEIIKRSKRKLARECSELRFG